MNSLHIYLLKDIEFLKKKSLHGIAIESKDFLKLNKFNYQINITENNKKSLKKLSKKIFFIFCYRHSPRI